MAENTLTIVNRTEPKDNTVRIAIYKKDLQRLSQSVVAWNVVNPAADGGTATVTVPDDFTLFADYTVDGTTMRTNTVSIESFSALLSVQGTRDDASGQITISLALEAEGLAAPVPGHVLVDVEDGLGRCVNVHIQQDGADVVPALRTPPNHTADFQVEPAYYLAWVHQETPTGAILRSEALSTHEAKIMPSQTATISGGCAEGYPIVVTD
jgi:hypothetical protein